MGQFVSLDARTRQRRIKRVVQKLLGRLELDQWYLEVRAVPCLQQVSAGHGVLGWRKGGMKQVDGLHLHHVVVGPSHNSSQWEESPPLSEISLKLASQAPKKLAEEEGFLTP
ncbi:UNVERIFIED_CONTAM: hypothetical protein K2H54_072997 [Gekko kuhli]